MSLPSAASPWRWIPSLYLVQGLPYVAVMTLSVVAYKNLGVSNTEIALLTSGFYLPWVLKPLWSPWVDLCGSPRRWVVGLQLAIALALLALAAALRTPHWLLASVAVFWLLAFASATHDIAADGFYLQALPPRAQAAFVGVRSAAYRAAMIGGQGGLVVLAGTLIAAGFGVASAWSVVFSLLAAVFVAAALLHRRVLPRPAPAALPVERPTLRAMRGVFAAYFRRPEIGRALAFVLLYRLGEAQLLKLVVPFLLDPREAGGLGLDTAQVGWVYGTLGIGALTAGGLLGGLWIARRGLERCLWPMLLATHLPNLLYVALAVLQPASLAAVGLCVVLEQFGYGLGFTAFLVVLLRLAQGPHPVAHYAIGTGLMALGMMLPGLVAGALQSVLGYPAFFVWACVATLPSFVAAAALRLPREEAAGPAGVPA
ncbi:MFS transporter [Piscinibacter sakaiensis]|uniref:AmpG permease n=1 Tax=Piscinibacter sakaiensis TaxID=1547922 RepID=A0A0K8P7J0_PISS1|nr:MFS transporter [Piscinibacter sakaiensis]GAP38494.1 AmpG permease [Piscinibacter sakaiensis]